MYVGDHISVPGERFHVSGAPLYRYHMIVVKVISEKKLRVLIHYRRVDDRKKAVITEENILVNHSIDVIYRIDYDQDEPYTGQEAMTELWNVLVNAATISSLITVKASVRG